MSKNIKLYTVITNGAFPEFTVTKSQLLYDVNSIASEVYWNGTCFSPYIDASEQKVTNLIAMPEYCIKFVNDDSRKIKHEVMQEEFINERVEAICEEFLCSQTSVWYYKHLWRHCVKFGLFSKDKQWEQYILCDFLLPNLMICWHRIYLLLQVGVGCLKFEKTSLLPYKLWENLVEYFDSVRNPGVEIKYFPEIDFEELGKMHTWVEKNIIQIFQKSNVH